MGKTRIELQSIFERFLNNKNVYFNPPENVRLKYPCIKYKLDDISVKHADNYPYHTERKYNVTLIMKESDTADPDRLLCLLPKASFDRSYVSDGLYHYVYSLYF